MNTYKPLNAASGPSRSDQSGLTLPELLLAMLLGLFITAGGISLFVTNKVVYTDTARLTELQENARFAHQYLLHDLRHAYFLGEFHDGDGDLAFESDTFNDTTIISNNCTHKAAPNDGPLVYGTKATDGAAISCIADAARIEGIPSDVLVLKMAAPRFITDDDHLTKGSLYLASSSLKNCVFQHTDGTDAPSVAPTCKGVDCDCFPFGSYSPYSFRAYYIRDADPLDGEPPTLSRKVLKWDPLSGLTIVTEDLVEGVEGMRILYSDRPIAAAGPKNPVPFKDAADPSIDWDRISAVRVHLLVRTLQPHPSHEDHSTYILGDTEVDFADANFATSLSQGAQLRNFHRRVVSATVMLRNKLP